MISLLLVFLYRNTIDGAAGFVKGIKGWLKLNIRHIKKRHGQNDCLICGISRTYKGEKIKCIKSGRERSENVQKIEKNTCNNIQYVIFLCHGGYTSNQR
jgi:hypothetical protein